MKTHGNSRKLLKIQFPQFSPVFRSFPQFCPVFPSFSQFSPIFMTSKTSIFLRARRKNDGSPDRQEETHKKYTIYFTEIQFSPVLPSSAQFCPVFPSFPQFSSVLLSFSSNFIEFHPVSPSVAQFSSIFTSFAQFCPVSRKLFQFFDFAVISFPLFCLIFCSCTCGLTQAPHGDSSLIFRAQLPHDIKSFFGLN